MRWAFCMDNLTELPQARPRIHSLFRVEDRRTSQRGVMQCMFTKRWLCRAKCLFELCQQLRIGRRAEYFVHFDVVHRNLQTTRLQSMEILPDEQMVMLTICVSLKRQSLAHVHVFALETHTVS
eukprot:GFYU01034311.1.p1 GENE.GFYU01034311.1~~GFYU01034311.1.p1  ORF type:complete len:141 (+),score=5.25 GFYU01034311.1:55-423(+)